jgi:hypothetical protein
MSSKDVFGKVYLYGYTDKPCGKVVGRWDTLMTWDRLQRRRLPGSCDIFSDCLRLFPAKAGPTSDRLGASIETSTGSM